MKLAVGSKHIIINVRHCLFGASAPMYDFEGKIVTIEESYYDSVKRCDAYHIASDPRCYTWSNNNFKSAPGDWDE